MFSPTGRKACPFSCSCVPLRVMKPGGGPGGAAGVLKICANSPALNELIDDELMNCRVIVV